MEAPDNTKVNIENLPINNVYLNPNLNLRSKENRGVANLVLKVFEMLNSLPIEDKAEVRNPLLRQKIQELHNGLGIPVNSWIMKDVRLYISKLLIHYNELGYFDDSIRKKLFPDQSKNQ